MNKHYNMVYYLLLLFIIIVLIVISKKIFSNFYNQVKWSFSIHVKTNQPYGGLLLEWIWWTVIRMNIVDCYQDEYGWLLLGWIWWVISMNMVGCYYDE
jgi:hypothetical protein